MRFAGMDHDKDQRLGPMGNQQNSSPIWARLKRDGKAFLRVLSVNE